MMRAWRSTFLFGGLCLALGALGCAIAPDDAVESREEVAAAESGLASQDADPSGGIDTVDPEDGDLGIEEPEPDPHPWRPPPTLWEEGHGPQGVTPEDADAEPDPHPWEPTRSDGHYVRLGAAP